ncbi:MAG: protein kinase [Chthoniobacterales bacterium]
MDPRRWEQTKQTFQETIACLPGDRAAFLARVCDGDEELRREATRLLEAHEKAGDFIESPAFATTPEFLLADPDALIGDRLGHYQIESVLGLGGMGVVYLARDEKLGRQVGLKLLPPSLVADEAQLERLQREARTASALNHPNIVTIHEIGEVNGTHYIATEYIEGITLRERLAQGSIPPNESLEIARQFVSALSVAHEAGIVHRDIKPENIMLRRDGLVKVLDFGIAKLAPSSAAESLLKTREGAVLGTVAYMSPEQARGLEVDARTDIWSAGVVLYEMLTGHQPFSGATPTDVIIALAERSPPTIRETQYGKMLGRALAKKREERYQSAKDLLADLRNHRDTPRGSPPSRKRRRLTVALLVALIIASFVSWFFLRRASPDRTQHAIKSLAVLPLANLSGDAAQDYFADGMTEALITDLAKVDALRVISRASVMQYKGTRKPLREIGDELKVDGVLTGSVARSGERMRVAVQLTQAATDENIWAQSYERDLRDALTLQREVARNIVSEIRIKLSPQDEVRFGRVGSVNPEAYDQYLRGQFYLHRQDRAENEAAIAALERAVALDSTFAAAHASLAQAYVWKLFLFAPEEQQLAEKAFVATEKALALDPNLAEAYLARGRLLWTPANRFPHEKAIREYRRALALNPGLDEARNQLALVYNHIGAFDEAFEELHRAVATNPSNTLAQFRIGQTLLFQGKYEELSARCAANRGKSTHRSSAIRLRWRYFISGGRTTPRSRWTNS